MVMRGATGGRRGTGEAGVRSVPSVFDRRGADGRRRADPSARIRARPINSAARTFRPGPSPFRATRPSGLALGLDLAPDRAGFRSENRAGEMAIPAATLPEQVTSGR